MSVLKRRPCAIAAVAAAALYLCGPVLAADTDGDGVDDALDNCRLVANPDQRDSNNDGFGNACDADLNNDGIVNVADLGQLRAAFFSSDEDADLNGDGTVNVADLGLMRQGFFQPPGPGADVNPVLVPAPFFRKPADGSPSLAPQWYANKGQVTTEVFYDASTSATANGSRLESILESASPGDHIVVHAGRYVTNGGRVYLSQRASAANPTVIRAADGEQVTIERENTSQNLMEFDVSYLIFENFRLVGGSIGLRFRTADHVVLHNNDVSGSNSTAITANTGPTSFLYFVDNEVHNASSHAEGFYLGAHDGSPTTRDCFVVGNYVHDLRGPGVTQGDGIEIKRNAERCLVKWNFVARTNYPGILVYGNNLGLADRIVIEENVIVDTNTHGIQAAADAIIRNNLIIGGNASRALSSQPHNGITPRNLEVYNNTLISNGTGIGGSSWQGGMVFSNNAIYSGNGNYFQAGGAATAQGNVNLNSLDAFVDLAADGSALDAMPVSNGPLAGAASSNFYAERDLFGRVRSGSRESGAVDLQ